MSTIRSLGMFITTLILAFVFWIINLILIPFAKIFRYLCEQVRFHVRIQKFANWRSKNIKYITFVSSFIFAFTYCGIIALLFESSFILVLSIGIVGGLFQGLSLWMVWSVCK